jgi:hypothetical protein
LQCGSDPEPSIYQEYSILAGVARITYGKDGLMPPM